jgi:hypothetical protein
MRKRRLLGLVLAVLSVGAGVPAGASALTLGDLPIADPGPCALGSSSAWIEQVASGTATYVVPSGGGIITSWSTSFGPAAAPVELVVSSPFPSSAPFTAVVRGVDYETLTNPLPTSSVSTFSLARPITVQAGDLIGLNVFEGSNTRCAFMGTGSDSIFAGGDEPVTPGGTITAAAAAANALVNVSANLVQSTDLSIAASVTPTAITSRGLADMTFPVGGGPIATATFTDTLPAGLVPVSALTDSGSCAISGQAVTCTLTSTPSTVTIAVRGTTIGMYSNTGQITSPLADPNPANNSASATLAVVRPTSGVCQVPTLRGAPLPVAKAVLRLLNCKVGKIRRAHSGRIPRGDVISTKPGPGRTAPVGTKVAIKVSAG